MKNNLKNKQLTRGAGLLLPISSLPSAYGIGTLGKEGYKFIDFLVRANQKYWQVLPVGPTSFGDSPYQSFSAFAGNPYFIDLDLLVEEELLEAKEINSFDWGNDETNVDYAKVFQSRFKVLRIAYNRSNHKEQRSYIDFCVNNKNWLEDYSFYMALKFYFNNNEWLLWDEDIRDRKDDAIEKYKNLLDDDIDFWKFCQFKFFEQWNNLKTYANENGIQLIGDIPLYVSLDSADVWVYGDLFELDERKKPINVAGVPPDAFSDEGQRWGNPLYRWDVMEKDNFHWWSERMKASSMLYDIIRIDHFIGVVTYYSIPASSDSAKTGEWRQGPGLKLTEVIDHSIGDAKIIAEDLGVEIPKVKEVLKESGYPGMKIIQFAFGGDAENEHLPHNYIANTVVYGGTHDNETLVGFFEGKKAEELKYAMEYLQVKDRKDIPDAVLLTAYQSVANVAIFQVQDILRLDNTARMNLPSTVGINWKWRLTSNQLKDKYAIELKKLVTLYGR